MNAIGFILRKTVKNVIVDTFRHPLKLVLYLFIIALMVYGAIMSYAAGNGKENEFLTGILERSAGRLISGAYLAILYFISIPIMLKGLSSGTSFFSLSDVANLFVAPISERLILVYGVGRQLASMLLLVVTFAAYGGMLINMFHLSWGDTLLLLGGIVLMLVIVQMVTLMIFSLASGHPHRARIMKYFIYAMAFFGIGSVVITLFSSGFTEENIYRAISLPFLEYVPVIGWMHGFVYGIMAGTVWKIAVFGGLLLLIGILSVIVVMNTSPDYYEDVLAQAESYHEFSEAVREGKFSDRVMMGNRRVALRKTGINGGSGAGTIFFKHLREGSRRAGLTFFNINTVVLILTGIVMAAGMKLAMPEVLPTIIYLAVTVILVYVQFFFSASGDWVKELTKPYIYLIPDGAVKKLVMAAATGLIKPFTDAAMTYVIVALFTGGELSDILISILVYGSFGSVYIAANILAQRLVGVESEGGIFITFYIGVIIITLLPGVIGGLLCLSTLAGEWGSVAATLLGAPILLWNIVISVLIFLACRNLLDNTQ